MLRLACVLLSPLFFFFFLPPRRNTGWKASHRCNVRVISKPVITRSRKLSVGSINWPYTHHLIYFIVFVIMSR